MSLGGIQPLEDLTPAPPTHTHTADVYKTSRDGTQGIMGYVLEPNGVHVYFVRSL